MKRVSSITFPFPLSLGFHLWQAGGEKKVLSILLHLVVNLKRKKWMKNKIKQDHEGVSPVMTVRL